MNVSAQAVYRKFHCSASVGSVATHSDMFQFVEVPIKPLVLQDPLRYAHSVLNTEKLQNSSVSSSLKDQFQKHCSALDLNPCSITDIRYFVEILELSTIQLRSKIDCGSLLQY